MDNSSNDDDIIAAAQEGFLEEAGDNLRQFERALLEMEEDPDNAEAVNGAFRAAHTIKGAAGLFGFEALVAFTHEVESLLDEMRAGKRALSEAAMAALLQGRDMMGRLVAQTAAPADDPELATAAIALAAELRALRGPAAATSHAAAAQPLAAASADQEATWLISLRMGADAFRNGLDPVSFLRYLDTLGTAKVLAVPGSVPDLQALDPETCHLGFEVRLDTDADRQRIEQVFEFLQEDCSLALLAPTASAEEREALLTSRAGTDATARDELLSLWQQLAGPGAAPFIERRSEPASDRRGLQDERRGGPRERRGGDESRSIRVSAQKLDRLIDLIGELVIASSGAQLVAQQEQSPAFAEAALRIHDLVEEARDGALGLRMVPIGETFTRFQRVVRDVCKQLGKDVELQITGADAELDKSMVETIADPLMHLVRNSLDHGIEGREERLASGKPAHGRLALNAYHESGSIVIEVTDDGRGLNRERILAKARERQLVGEGVELDDEAIHQLIFAPGFSTAAEVTNLSGRGVGMDVVKRNIESLRGQIRIASQPGLGTTMQIRLPLTLAIIDGFLTRVGKVSYVLPLDLVSECIEIPKDCLQQPAQVSGHFDLRGEVLPYLDIGLFHGHPRGAEQRRSVVVVRDGTSRIGLVVDRLMGEHQTVIKPLGDVFQHIRGLSGCTILGSGEVALILDIPALLNMASRPPSSHSTSSLKSH